MDSFILAQALGVVAVVFSLLMYQFNNRKIMLILDFCSNVFWALTFLELGASTGLCMVVIAAISNLVFVIAKPNKKNQWMLMAILVSIVTATVVTWNGASGLLAMIGSVLFTVRFWTTSTKTIRRLSLTAPPFWFAYDLLTANYPGVFIEVCGVLSNVFAQYRFDVPGRRHPKQK